jgi:NADH-quinone oxidoreductase subunit M
MGAYGFLRFSLPMLPEASVYFSTLMLALSALAIVYGGLLALAQDDLKKLVAYSSISHMGFVTLGIFALNQRGLQGSILQMFNHGVTTGALFLFVGLIYERTHSRSIADYGGLMKVAPVYTSFLALFTLSSMALPGTNSFVGELLVLSGGFAASLALGAVAVLGALLSAAYLLGMYRKVALGPAKVVARYKISDVNGREMAAILPLALFVLWVGLYPRPFLEIIDASVQHLLVQVHGEGSGP